MRELSRSIDEIATVPILTSVQTTRASQVTDLLRTVVAAAVAAGIVVIAFALVLGPTRRSTRDVRRTPGPATQAAPPTRLMASQPTSQPASQLEGGATMATARRPSLGRSYAVTLLGSVCFLVFTLYRVSWPPGSSRPTAEGLSGPSQRGR